MLLLVADSIESNTAIGGGGGESKEEEETKAPTNQRAHPRSHCMTTGMCAQVFCVCFVSQKTGRADPAHTGTADSATEENGREVDVQGAIAGAVGCHVNH